jgi:site-specific DNA-methyltransferase (adenine-specific)
MNALELRNYENLNEEEKNVFRIALRDNMKNELMQIKDIETGVDYLNKVKAIETWAKAEKKDSELQNIIGEQKLRTQKTLGFLVKEGQDEGKIQSQGGGNKKQTDQEEVCSVTDLGLTHKNSSTFKKIASLPDEIFEKEIETAKAETNKRIELTTSRMLKVAKQYELDKKRDIESEKVKTVNINDNVINGDSLKVLNDLDDGVIDIVITDPPYGINYKSNSSIYDNTITKRGLLNDGDEAFELLDKTCEILQRKTSENAHLYFFCSWAVFSKFESIIGKYFTIKTPLVWDKKNLTQGDLYNDWSNQTEIIIYCVKGKKGFNKRKGNLLSVSRLHTSKMVHPTQKPVELIKHILDASALKNDFIVDPFMGSGSTIKACNEYGLKSLGIELDEEMFLIANKFINE